MQLGAALAKNEIKEQSLDQHKLTTYLQSVFYILETHEFINNKWSK